MSKDIELVVGKGIELRDRRSALKKKYEEEDAKLKEGIAKAEEWLHKKLVSLGAKSVKTPAGTAFCTHKEYANVADWKVFIEHVKKTGNWGLLEKRVSKTACKEHMAADANGNYTEDPPPGVNFIREEVAQIRRPS